MGPTGKVHASAPKSVSALMPGPSIDNPPTHPGAVAPRRASAEASEDDPRTHGRKLKN